MGSPLLHKDVNCIKRLHKFCHAEIYVHKLELSNTYTEHIHADSCIYTYVYIHTYMYVYVCVFVRSSKMQALRSEHTENLDLIFWKVYLTYQAGNPGKLTDFSVGSLETQDELGVPCFA